MAYYLKWLNWLKWLNGWGGWGGLVKKLRVTPPKKEENNNFCTTRPARLVKTLEKTQQLRVKSQVYVSFKTISSCIHLSMYVPKCKELH